MTTLSTSGHYQQPAARKERWRADLIDGILLFAARFLSAFIGNALTSESSSTEVWQVTSLLIIFSIQTYFLLRSGQTVGKKIMRLRVVMAGTGEHPSWVQFLLLRPLGVVISAFPVIGRIIDLVDRFLLFHEDRRTIEDRISGTKIVSEQTN